MADLVDLIVTHLVITADHWQQFSLAQQERRLLLLIDCLRARQQKHQLKLDQQPVRNGLYELCPGG